VGQLEPGIIEPEDPNRPLTIHYAPRHMNAYPVLEAELDRFESGFASLDVTMFGVVLGSLLSLALAWFASPPSGTAVFVFTGAAAGLAPLLIFFGWRVLMVRAELKRMRASLRERANDPNWTA
jgi:hypothetical protein